jgi:predicted enzyme related to lactoylglutathione lyase
MNRVVHFEIPAADPDALGGFYARTFGWTIQKWGEGDMEYWLVGTGPQNERGIDGGLLRRRDPAQPVVNTIDVASLDAAMAAVEENGGRIVVPKMAIPGVGWLAYFKDPEDNIFGMMESDAAAG